MMTDRIDSYFARHLEILEMVRAGLSETIADCAGKIGKALGAGGKVLLMGNGGSAADAQHFAAELVGRFMLERRALPAIALTTDTSVLTAVANDYGFEEVFRRQIEALALPGDVVMAISTSGKSANLVKAIETAGAIGCTTVGLLGRDGGAIAPLVDISLTVPALDTPHIQEAHITIIHLLCDLVEQSLR